MKKDKNLRVRFEIPNKLRNGETVELDGYILRMLGDGEVMEVGDIYVAERNCAPEILTVREVVPIPTKENGLDYGGWVVPQEPKYCFDIKECVKVEVLGLVES